MDLEIKFIRTDGGTQARAKLDPETVDEYRDAFRDSDGTWPFPPVIAFHDGSAYWLADGFHRIAAARLHGRFVCEADVRQGTQRDAVLFAAGANADHGLRRTNEDKRRAVLRLLEDAEWGQWSDREIARRCKVSPTFVGFLRREVLTVHVDSERKYTTKHGGVSTMNTEAIGRESENNQQSRKFVHHKTGDYSAMNTTKIGKEFAIEVPDEEAGIIKNIGYSDAIYILFGNRHYKIGYTTNLEKRYLALASSPDVKLVHAFRGSREDETKLHKLFSQYRVSGEWFDLPENIISSLMGITSSDQLSDLEESGDLSENDWETAVPPAPIETHNGTDYRRETITNAHGQTETRWQPVAPAPSLVDGPLNQMRQALSMMKYPGDHARAFRQWQAEERKREDGMMFGAIARLIEILVDELEADRKTTKEVSGD